MAEHKGRNQHGSSNARDDQLPRFPELFFGIVGAVGTDLSHVTDILARELQLCGYSSHPVRLSGLLAECDKYAGLPSSQNSPEDERITAFMDAGDDFRRTAKRGDAVALLAIGKIRGTRAGLDEKDGSRDSKRAFILNSLKHPEEVELLRKLYGSNFFLLSAYESSYQRKSNLCELIAKSTGKYDSTLFSDDAENLISRDEKDVNDEFGQNVRDTFPKADLFINSMDKEIVEREVQRFIKLLFNHPFITPTIDEYSMFHAKATALRSADLSRQVGAVISDSEGGILAAGCNEVPKPGGGSVWECQLANINQDNRDFRIGYDSSERMAHELVTELLESLSQCGWLGKNYRDKDKDVLARQALFDGDHPPLRGTRAASILEFGRVVHAEMHALSDAAKRGVSIKGAKLYCTTFPCHMCARHIIASGVASVVYIEPYPKSMTKILYQESVNIDHESSSREDAVNFLPFTGVAPRRYIDLFEKSDRRKDDRGRAIDWIPEGARPRVGQIPTYTEMETGYVDLLETNKENWGIIDSDSKSG